MVKKMKKIIMLGVFISICILLMASSASAVEYRAVIEQNTKEIISQETTNDINTFSEKLTKLIPTMKITHSHTLVLLILKFIRLIFSTMRTFFGIPVTILLLILLQIITAPFNLIKIIRLIIFMMRTIVRISGLILIQILKIIRFPFKLISKSITLLINFIRLIILLPIIRIGIHHPLLTDITGRFSKVIT
jgi:hypothetical protein